MFVRHGEGNKANAKLILHLSAVKEQMRNRRTGDRAARVLVGPTCTAGEMQKSQKDRKTQIALSSGLINDTFIKLYICTYTV